MSKHLNIEFEDEDEFEHMRRVKDWNGVTWAEVVQRGIETLEEP